MVRIAAAASLLALVSAVPTSSPTWYSLAQLARFDNDNGIPLVAAAPIDIYYDIYWQGMSLAQTVATSLLGLEPNSPPNYAAYSALDVATVEQGQPAMTVNYDDSTIDHFDLHSFYYGCAAAAQTSAVGVPLSCTVTVVGYADDQATKQTGSQTFTFSVAALQLQAQMQQAVLGKGFAGIKRANFYVSDDTTTAALIDTVSYTVYGASPIGN